MKKDTEKEKWWAMNREERLRRQKDFLTGFAFWVVWLVILWVVLKAAGSVLFPFLAAFAVAVLLSGAVQFIAERMHIQRGIVAVAVVLFFYIILAVFLYFAGSYLVRLIYDTARELSVFFSDTIVPVMQRFYQWLDRFVSVFYPTELTGKTSGLHGVGEESAQTLKNAGKLMSGISDGVIDGVSGMAAGIPGFFMKLLITVIATVFMELEFPQIRAFLKRQIPVEYQRAFRDGKNYAPPIYDNGGSLLAWATDEELTDTKLRYQLDKSKPFRSHHAQQIKLVDEPVRPVRDLDTLYTEIIQAISPILALLSEKRASAIRQYLKYRLHYLKAAMG